MPILHRNVVPNVPAWTADNGKIIFRNGAPSHQRLMRFSVEWSGNLNLSEWAAEYPNISTWLDLSMTAADINAALAVSRQGGTAWRECDCHYNDPYVFTIGQSSFDYYASTMNIPAYSFEPGGRRTKYLDESPEILVGVEWDAANQWWRWHARIYRMRFRFYYSDGGADFYHSCNLGFQVSGDRYALYQSAQSSQAIRAGNGVTLNFAGIHTDSASYPWAASALSGTSLIVSAAYAA